MYLGMRSFRVLLLPGASSRSSYKWHVQSCTTHPALHGELGYQEDFAYHGRLTFKEEIQREDSSSEYEVLSFFAITWALVASFDRETEPGLEQVRDVTGPDIPSIKRGYYHGYHHRYHPNKLGACGGGGWTLVMKIDGSKRTFHYDSKLWTNRRPYNPAGGRTGLDHVETKLRTYWTTRFTKICLGMKRGGKTRFVLVNQAARSLYSLIADGHYRATTLGRDTWKSLIGCRKASLQHNCNKEGFNCFVKRGWPRVRIGILGNEQNNCGTPDSRIGFGGGGHPDDNNTCGNAADGKWHPDNGGKDVKTMGYIFVQ